MGKEGRAACHLFCWKEGLTIQAERGGVESGDRKGVLEEGDLGWARRKVQEPTRWTPIIDSLSPGLHQVGVPRGGPAPSGGS